MSGFLASVSWLPFSPPFCSGWPRPSRCGELVNEATPELFCLRRFVSLQSHVHRRCHNALRLEPYVQALRVLEASQEEPTADEHYGGQGYLSGNQSLA